MNRDRLRLSVFFRPFRYTGYSFTVANYLLVVLTLPALLHGVSLYGIYAVRVVSLSVAACMSGDALFELLFRKRSRLYDGSALLCGFLLGLLLPPTMPWWTVAIGGVSAVFLGRQLFGGAGGSPFNAVCIGWAVLAISWPKLLDPSTACIGFSLSFEQVEYPLSVLRRLGAPALELFPLKALLLGNQAGCIGTGPSLLLLGGGVVAVLLGLVHWIIPASFLGTIVVTSLLFIPAGSVHWYQFSLMQLFTGYTMIGAFFLAADFSSRPVAPGVMVLYGAIAGILTVLFRVWSVFPEGLPFALLIVNMAVPLLDRGRRPAGTVPEVVRI
jgi:Na+-translocating ferredoxin:NAD+ oxidoreductase subunit D